MENLELIRGEKLSPCGAMDALKLASGKKDDILKNV